MLPKKIRSNIKRRRKLSRVGEREKVLQFLIIDPIEFQGRILFHGANTRDEVLLSSKGGMERRKKADMWPLLERGSEV